MVGRALRLPLGSSSINYAGSTHNRHLRGSLSCARRGAISRKSRYVAGRPFAPPLPFAPVASFFSWLVAATRGAGTDGDVRESSTAEEQEEEEEEKGLRERKSQRLRWLWR